MSEDIDQRSVRFCERQMTDGELYPVATGEAVVFSCASPASDSPNEDAAALIPLSPGRAVLVVADGVGGRRGGGQASSDAIQQVCAAIDGAVEDDNSLRGAILDGIERANQLLSARNGGATTIAAVALEQGTARTFHVGDSAVLIVGQRGRVKQLTVSHSPIGYALESGYMEEQEALDHPERHLILNAVGSGPSMNIEVGSSVKLAARDTVLIASDGLFDNFYIEEIVARVRKGPLQKVSAALAADCLARMRADADAPHPSKADDLTFIIFRPTPSRSARRGVSSRDGS